MSNFSPASSEWFTDAIAQITLDFADWIHQHELPGGWSYIRYDEMFDFLVAPSGDRISSPAGGTPSTEAFQTYALGRVLSFALVKMGREPFHGLTVVVGGKAVAFLGASTFGKSSLAACFVAAGFPLLADDILCVEKTEWPVRSFSRPTAPETLSHRRPGVPRNQSRGIEDESPRSKARLPAFSGERSSVPTPLTAIYALTAPRDVHQNSGQASSRFPCWMPC